MNSGSLKPGRQSMAMGLFGLCVIGSGLWRFFSAEGGHAGLWFGLVMGGLAILSSFIFAGRKPIVAHFTGWASILFVGGWFCYESFVKKGWSNAEPRQLLIIAITIVTAGVMIASRSRDKSPIK